MPNTATGKRRIQDLRRVKPPRFFLCQGFFRFGNSAATQKRLFPGPVVAGNSVAGPGGKSLVSCFVFSGPKKRAAPPPPFPPLPVCDSPHWELRENQLPFPEQQKHQPRPVGPHLPQAMGKRPSFFFSPEKAGVFFFHSQWPFSDFVPKIPTKLNLDPHPEKPMSLPESPEHFFYYEGPVAPTQKNEKGPQDFGGSRPWSGTSWFFFAGSPQCAGRYLRLGE